MTFYRTDLHSKQVDDWSSQNADSLSAKMQVQIYSKAISALETRSKNTLSSITVLAVIDRVLHESKEKAPILAAVGLKADGMDLSGLLETCEKYKKDDLTKSLRLLITELLTILCDITADILTDPLHQELSKITSEQIPDSSDIQDLNAKATAKMNRDAK